MIPRYTPPDFEELWSPATRFSTWLRVELAACDALEKHGTVPAGTAEAIRGMNLRLDPSRIDAIERQTRHDVIAFLTHVEELAGPPARWLHRGMTSSDVLDTSFAVLLGDAGEKLLARTDVLAQALASRAKEHRATAMIGRSHGVHAEPITFGLALAGHLAEVRRARRRLSAARDQVRVGTISGAVGTFAHLSPDVERDALAALGLRAETVPTQVVARDRHADFFHAIALVGAAVERLALQVRHWQRTEVLEAEEPFGPGQKGSSAMPHKRNPIVSENLCGLSRLLRAYANASMEDIALWHERDISHSSVERVIAPDATTVLAYMLDRAAWLVAGLVVHPARMRENLERTDGLWASESLMLGLIDAGLARQQAYVIVQRSAMRAWAGEGRFREFLSADPEATQHLSEASIERAFSLESALRHVDAVIDRALDDGGDRD